MATIEMAIVGGEPRILHVDSQIIFSRAPFCVATRAPVLHPFEMTDAEV